MPSSGRERVRMTDAEVSELLSHASKVQVGTVNPDGSPHLTTLFHAVLDGRIAFWTYGRSQKVKNLQRDPRITCLVESGEDYFSLRGVSVTGRADLITDEDGVRRVGTAVATRMVGGADLGSAGRREVERQVTKRVAVLVTPERTVSWDHRKMLASTES